MVLVSLCSRDEVFHVRRIVCVVVFNRIVTNATKRLSVALRGSVNALLIVGKLGDVSLRRVIR